MRNAISTAFIVVGSVLVGCGGGSQPAGEPHASTPTMPSTTPAPEPTGAPAPPGISPAISPIADTHDAGAELPVADAGTASASDAGAPVPSSGGTVNIVEADNGKTVTAKKGQTIVITLPFNASTGYDWTVARVSKTLGQPKLGSTAANTMVPGAGGLRTLTWSTSGALDTRGSHAIELNYKRSFEQGKPPIRTFKVTVKVE